ncbi:MAG: hypothetical protein WBA07_10810 [Rivularia sp. (in: cyanobacteria)]
MPLSAPKYERILKESVRDFFQNSFPAITVIGMPLITAEPDLLVELKAIAVVN